MTLLSKKLASPNDRLERILQDQKQPGIVRHIRIAVAERQTFRYGFYVLLASSSIPLLILFGVPFLCPALLTSTKTAVIGRLATVAEIVAGIAGILMAVVVFGVELHAQREDEGAFMTRYLLKTNFVHWTVGFCLGFAAFNTYVLTCVGDKIWMSGLVGLEVVGITLLFVSTFRILALSIDDATESTLDQTYSLFLRDLARSIADRTGGAATKIQPRHRVQGSTVIAFRAGR